MNKVKKPIQWKTPKWVEDIKKWGALALCDKDLFSEYDYKDHRKS